MRAAIWAYIGHGADLISYWQWRDALNGGEANHGALVDVDGEPDPIYEEYSQIGSEFEKAGPAIQGTSPNASVAILHSYPSRWDINWQKMNPAYDAIDGLMSYYTPLHELGYSDRHSPTRPRSLANTSSSLHRAWNFSLALKQITSRTTSREVGTLFSDSVPR